MKPILFAWLGLTDIKATDESSDTGLGPIANALVGKSFSELVILNDLNKKQAAGYTSWLESKVDTPFTVIDTPLNNPTDFELVYRTAAKVVEATLKRRGIDSSVAFHTSPGTPVMAAVWILLAKTRFQAELIQSSKEEGVRTMAVPLDISAEFIPELLRRPDQELARLSQGLPPKAPGFENIIHRSPEMKRVVAKAQRVAPRSVPVLIEGESGTGKELLARAIHQGSTRREAQLIAVNCGAIAESLVEAELFGHSKGAFTGAAAARKGYFQEANGGTLFLDEVGELPLLTQVKLLRALQEGEVTPVGASRPVKVDVRIITATNRDLVAEVVTGRFREDLYYRLAVALIKLPPLRERSGDLGLLIDLLMKRINQESKKEPNYINKKISTGARNVLLNHPWPGNVRELLNTLRRAAVWSPGASISEAEMRDALYAAPRTVTQGILNRPLGDGLDLAGLLAQAARHYLERALVESNGNKTKAAKLVGLSSYQTLTNWLKRYGIDHSE
jgi:transcriptional regulator with GAF, ATPase, and Fis domain